MRRLAPVLLDAARLLQGAGRDRTRFLLPVADPRFAPQIEAEVARRGLEGAVVTAASSHDALRAADLAILASGTASLEAALLGTPMVITYRVAALTTGVVRSAIALGLMDSDTVGLPNLVLGRRAIPERIQRQATGAEVAAAASRLLEDASLRAEQRQALAEVSRLLFAGGSDARAAEAVLAAAERRVPCGFPPSAAPSPRKKGAVDEDDDARRARGARRGRAPTATRARRSTGSSPRRRPAKGPSPSSRDERRSPRSARAARRRSSCRPERRRRGAPSSASPNLARRSSRSSRSSRPARSAGRASTRAPTSTRRRSWEKGAGSVPEPSWRPGPASARASASIPSPSWAPALASATTPSSFPGVVLYPGVTVGCRVRIHAGSVIGSDGFGYERDARGVQEKVPQIGTVEIADDVEIGANSCVDRATIGATRIGAGTKIDNLVQVGHNTQVGEHCCVIGQAGLAGSVKVGRFSVLAGQAGIADHVTIAEGTVVGAQAGVPGDIGPGRLARRRPRSSRRTPGASSPSSPAFPSSSAACASWRRRSRRSRAGARNPARERAARRRHRARTRHSSRPLSRFDPLGDRGGAERGRPRDALRREPVRLAARRRGEGTRRARALPRPEGAEALRPQDPLRRLRRGHGSRLRRFPLRAVRRPRRRHRDERLRPRRRGALRGARRARTTRAARPTTPPPSARRPSRA